jgi:uncharacterized membrane protein YqjE
MEREQLGPLGAQRDGAPETEILITTTGGAAGPSRTAGAEPSLGDLLKQLTTDTGDLVRQEVALARAEIRQVGGTLARDGTRLGIALGLALAGALALTAFLVIAIGDLFNNYWLGALVVGLVLLAVGAVLAKSAINDVKRRGLTPDQTLASLKENAAWAKQETREVKRELTR